MLQTGGRPENDSGRESNGMEFVPADDEGGQTGVGKKG